MRLATWTYRLAAAWGVLVFALVFQLVFLMISRASVRARALMPITALEK